MSGKTKLKNSILCPVCEQPVDLVADYYRVWFPMDGQWYHRACSRFGPSKNGIKQRYRFLSDDDGHHYLIPVGKEEAFARWFAAGPYWENYEGEEFYSIGCSISCFTFSEPQEDK